MPASLQVNHKQSRKVQYCDTVFKWKLYTCELIPVGQRVLDVRGGRENQYVAIIPRHTLHTRALVHRRQDIQLSVANCDHCKELCTVACRVQYE